MQSKLNIIDPNRVLETKVLCQKSDLILERMAMGIAVRTEASRLAVISSYAGNTSCTHQDVPLLPLLWLNSRTYRSLVKQHPICTVYSWRQRSRSSLSIVHFSIVVE